MYSISVGVRLRKSCLAHLKHTRLIIDQGGGFVYCGCGLCLRECPVGAISGEPNQPHVIDPDLCTRCRLCYDVCPVGAVEIVR